MPAGLARPGSSPAASLTVDWQRQVPVSVVGCVPAPGHWVSVAELQPGGGMSGIPIGHTQNIANPGVLVATQHLDHANGCDNLAVHTHNNLQGSVWSQATLVHMDIPDFQDWGWHKDSSGRWLPFWTTLQDSSKACSILLQCGCDKSCTRNCKCSRAGVRWTGLCKCEGGCVNNEET